MALQLPRAVAVKTLMGTIIGLVVVMGAVLGGFAMAGGPFPVLFQPSELVVIGGAAFGTLIISAPGKIGKRVLHAFKKGFGNHIPKASDYEDLLKLLYGIFQLTRREGMLALESHLENPKESALFKRYPSVTHRDRAMVFLTDALRQLVDGCTVGELGLLFDAELEAHHEEEHQPITLLKGTSDALPGLGIVAAVLGIVVTMGHMDGGPAVIGHHVAAALVGTFLGILMCYGMLGPIATSIELQAQAETRYLIAIREGVLCAARGNAPELSIEFARRVIFSDERPTTSDMVKLIAAAKGQG
jgi:chemotaxis protein MotA